MMPTFAVLLAVLSQASAFRLLPTSRSLSQPTAAARAPVFLSEDAPAAEAPQAYIEFIIGVPEPVVPDVSLTRSKDGSTGVATFTFDNPTFLQAATQELGETTGMYLKDSEGTMKTSEVTATFTNGKPRIVKAVVVMKDTYEWDRFMRYAQHYRAQGHPPVPSPLAS